MIQYMFISLICSLIFPVCEFSVDIEDNEFAEFEDFDDDVPVKAQQTPSKSSSHQNEKAEQESNQADEVEDATVEDEVDDDSEEFQNFQDDEFEDYNKEHPNGKPNSKDGPKITITKVPFHLVTSWDSFHLEILMILGLVVYFINFFTGRTKNQKLATALLNSHRSILEENFCLIGDDSKPEIDLNISSAFRKESESFFTLWCSGRTCCEGMLLELIFIKRQDLVALLSQLFKPTHDRLNIKVFMNKEDMDSFVFCLANKHAASRLAKDMIDLSIYCGERKSGDKFNIPPNFQVMSEIGEVTSFVLDSKLISLLTRKPELFESIHISDQYQGAKQPDDTSNAKTDKETKKVLIFSFNIPSKKPISEIVEDIKPLFSMVIYFIDRVKRFRLTKEGKQKADRNRARAEEAFLKTTHAVRAEAAATRKEEKRRQEKERIMQEEDPEKQRRWEEKELKREMKKKAPKMKQLKVKAL